MRFVIITLSMLLAWPILASKGYSSQNAYVEDWYRTAIHEMIEFKIPASITLAQGLLESNYGNSDLAKYANNHFGIKCADWKGDTFYQDDDKKDECFRKYDNAKQSYEDHSQFLANRSRYAFLFQLDITDYKGWAKGLKKAGYATNPKYPDLLIDLIEKLDLYKYDEMGLNPKPSIVLNDKTKSPDVAVNSSRVEKSSSKKIGKWKMRLFSPFQKTDRVVYKQANRVKYIVAKDGDTFYKIAQEFELTLSQLHKYNDFPQDKDHLNKGDIVYLQPKRSASGQEKRYKTKADETVASISQATGVKISTLLKKNNLATASTIVNKNKSVQL